MWSSLQQTRTPGMHSHSRHTLLLFYGFLHRHHVTCRHLPRPALRSTVTHISLSLSHLRLATFARIQEKNHFVAHSPHAKSAFPAQTNSPVMHGYTVTITAQQPLLVPAKKTRCLCPLQMAGMMRISLSPRESLKRRPGAEQTVMTRCVYVEPSFILLMPCIRLLGILRSPNT
jgi:hypothetical protein